MILSLCYKCTYKCTAKVVNCIANSLFDSHKLVKKDDPVLDLHHVFFPNLYNIIFLFQPSPALGVYFNILVPASCKGTFVNQTIFEVIKKLQYSFISALK